MRFGVALTLFALAAGAMAQSGWARFRVQVKTPEQAQRLSDSNLELFSDRVSLGETDVVVGPGQMFELMRLRMRYQVVSVLPDPRGWANQRAAIASDFRNAYYRYNDIIQQYEAWRAANPNWVSRTQIGTTHNGLPVYAYRFYKSVNNSVETKSQVMLFGIHAREWISPACGLYISDQIINAFQGDHTKRFDVNTAYYVVPVLNPDGYEYCWTNNRLWRKNRRNNGGGSFGVDLNRNFSYEWGGQGSSGNRSSSTYRGPSAFSEPETQAVRDFVATLPDMISMIDFHSYGEYILWPWSYSEMEAPNGLFRAYGNGMDKFMKNAHGHDYTDGPSGATLYLASGVTEDWAYGVHGAYGYVIELRDTGQFGFILPEDQISPTQDEAWAAFVGLQTYLRRGSQ